MPPFGLGVDVNPATGQYTKEQRAKIGQARGVYDSFLFNTDTREAFFFQYHPTEVERSVGFDFRKLNSPNQKEPKIRFAGGAGQEITCRITFLARDYADDIQAASDKFIEFCAYDDERKRPPKFVFGYGKNFLFQCYVSSVGGVKYGRIGLKGETTDLLTVTHEIRLIQYADEPTFASTIAPGDVGSYYTITEKDESGKGKEDSLDAQELLIKKITEVSGQPGDIKKLQEILNFGGKQIPADILKIAEDYLGANMNNVGADDMFSATEEFLSNPEYVQWGYDQAEKSYQEEGE